MRYTKANMVLRTFDVFNFSFPADEDEEFLLNLVGARRPPNTLDSALVKKRALSWEDLSN